MLYLAVFPFPCLASLLPARLLKAATPNLAFSPYRHSPPWTEGADFVIFSPWHHFLWMLFSHLSFGSFESSSLRLSSGSIQVFKYVFTVVYGCEIFCRMKVNIKIPEVDTKVDEQSDTVEMSFGRCQVEGSVAIVVTPLGISAEIRKVKYILKWSRFRRFDFLKS